MDVFEAIFDRPPTKEETAGMNWWNNLTPRGRTYWLDKADSARPVDAYGCYRAFAGLPESPPLRFESGYSFLGTHFEINIRPAIDGRFRISVVALGSLTGLNGPVNLIPGRAEVLSFPIDGIEINPPLIDCWGLLESPDTEASFSKGFRLVADNEVCARMQKWLPRLAKTAKLSEAVAQAAKLQLGEGDHSRFLDDYVTGLAAHVVLDRMTPLKAIERRTREHWAGHVEPFFMFVILSNEIRLLLQEAAGTSAQGG